MKVSVVAGMRNRHQGEPRLPALMRYVWKVRLLGGMLLLAAVAAYVGVPDSAGAVLAASLAVVGAFVIVVVAEPSVPSPVAADVLAGDARSLVELARGLHLEGSPIYVHDQGNVGEERMFLPTFAQLRRVPVLDASTTAYAGSAATAAGLAVVPPGLPLLNRYTEDAEVDLKGAPVPEIEGALRGMLEAGDLGRGAELTEVEGALELRFRAGSAPPPCFADPSRPLCAETGCALCQAAGCALARGLQRPVVVEHAEITHPMVRVRYRPAEELV